jgi:tetratricopeptide (TPR) repeat protein
LLRNGLDIYRESLGEAHPLVAAGLNSLAHVLVGQRRYDEAAAVLTQALEIARAALGDDHQLVAIYMVNLAAVQLAREKPAEADPLLRRALEIRSIAPEIVPSRRRTLPEDDWSVGAIARLLEESEK